MDHDEILRWLRETDPGRIEELWAHADRVRRDMVGDEVHLRGLIEISNHCVQQCGYCGLHRHNKKVQRYRMSREEIIGCIRQAVAFGYGTVVMQSGEDYGITTEWMADIIRWTKANTPLAVTLSFGERPDDDLKRWREAGADRYLLRFETSDPVLYAHIHPPLPNRTSDRFALLRLLRELGYETGSGVMIGIPGQTYDTLANDICAFREMDLDMIGVGPYLSHPDTFLGIPGGGYPRIDPAEQVPNAEDMVYRVVALTRLVCPEANIPSTTALATINKDSGREQGLARGANVIMPNLTPQTYRALYEIYPAKACIDEAAGHCADCVQHRIRSIGRQVGRGPGFRVTHSP
ncbi:MAG: [FeFe] hydrogenase H-cluster radical SAM maturase HydE [Spartobacteria bacterium]|nr:[FeFe] hydrogenase H-cluster radical SAM maturase HydE [Spartobacteria bacterium]